VTITPGPDPDPGWTGLEDGFPDDTEIPGHDQPPETPQLAYPSVADWVQQYLVVVYARPIDTSGRFFWCRRWWLHDEALDRLDALWRAWEATRLDGNTGPATWWTTYADPIMTTLLSPTGPFRKCDNAHHAPPEQLTPPLPVDAAPAELFPPGQ